MPFITNLSLWEHLLQTTTIVVVQPPTVYTESCGCNHAVTMPYVTKLDEKSRRYYLKRKKIGKAAGPQKTISGTKIRGAAGKRVCLQHASYLSRPHSVNHAAITQDHMGDAMHAERVPFAERSG
jgi:hypothetical protein